MALVGVVDVGLRGAGEPRPQAQGPDAADAEQHLLLEALLTTAAVEAVGDVAGGLVVAGDVGVEQQQRDAAHLGAQHVGAQLAAAGQVEGDDAGLAVVLAQQAQGQAVGVEDRVGLLLPAVAVEALLEVAGLVEEADADDRDAEVGGGLEVVAGEDAETAGVLRQHLGDAELGAEVGDGAGSATLGLLGPRLEPAGLGEIGVQLGLGQADGRDEVVVGGQVGQLLGRQGGQEADRVLADGDPALGVDPFEEVSRGRVPGPAEVAGQVAERCNGLGQNSTDAEASDGLHGWHPTAS